MAIYSSEYLKRVATEKKILFESQQRLFSDRKVPETTEFDIFLSHSFLDKSDIQGLYQELTDFGFKVYVDWIVDPHLDRKNVTKSSAKLIQTRLRLSKSLLLAISTNATMSKWMPWELGYVDGATKRCAIVPVSFDKNPPKYLQRAEYLMLYPFVKKARTRSGIDKLWVIDSEFTYSFLDTWILDGKLEEDRITNIYDL